MPWNFITQKLTESEIIRKRNCHINSTYSKIFSLKYRDTQTFSLITLEYH